jgi:hypothetical protein
MTRSAVIKAEAGNKQWSGEERTDGCIKVSMCLQCQIDRSANQNPQR